MTISPLYLGGLILPQSEQSQWSDRMALQQQATSRGESVTRVLYFGAFNVTTI